MTRAELLDAIGADELALWREFYRDEPWGSRAEDERHAHLCTVVNNSMGGKERIKVFRIRWGPSRPPKLHTFADGIAAMTLIFGKAKKG